MIFEKLTLHNFGAYQGEHVVDLSVTPERPVVLVGALNGSGKTTLLEATQLALFGRAVRGTSRSRMAYQEYLGQLINRNVRPEIGASVGLTFRHRSGGRDDRFSITRTWRKAGAAIKEEIEVLRNDALDTEATERWLEFVEEFLPVQLADLFLFDGERIEALADPERSAEFLKAGIHALLGLDLVDHLTRTLVVHERGKRLAGAADQAPREYLERAEAALNSLRQRSADLALEKGAAVENVTRAERVLRSARQRLVKQGGNLLADRALIVAAAQHASDNLALREAAALELASGEAPLLLLTELIDEAKSLATSAEQASVAKRVHDVLVGRDDELSALLATCKVSRAARTRIQAFLEQSRAQWQSTSKTLSPIGISSGGFESLTEEWARELRTEVRNQLKALGEADAAFKSAELRKNAIPSEESVASTLAEVRHAEEGVSQSKARVEVLGVEYAKLQNQIERAEGTFKRAQEAVRELELKDEVEARIVRHSTRARETLERFRKAVAAKNVVRLESLITERFQAILRKKDSLVNRVRVHPETFELQLHDREGRELEPLLLSAGERQLLAVAIVWALAQASGRLLPTVIDTPLGRLDGEHRSRLVESYFPCASHQVILLSTDEEINGRYYTQLRSRVSREYLISFDPEARSSRIEPGYFPQHQRAVA